MTIHHYGATQSEGYFIYFHMLMVGSFRSILLHHKISTVCTSCIFKFDLSLFIPLDKWMKLKLFQTIVPNYATCVYMEPCKVNVIFYTIMLFEYFMKVHLYTSCEKWFLIHTCLVNHHVRLLDVSQCVYTKCRKIERILLYIN